MVPIFVSVDRSNRVQFHGTTEGQHGAQGAAQREAQMKNGRAFRLEGVELKTADPNPRGEYQQPNGTNKSAAKIVQEAYDNPELPEPEEVKEPKKTKKDN